MVQDTEIRKFAQLNLPKDKQRELLNEDTEENLSKETMIYQLENCPNQNKSKQIISNKTHKRICIVKFDNKTLEVIRLLYKS